MNLNSQQLEAVNHINGPGSGKTRVISHRIVNMIYEKKDSFH